MKKITLFVAVILNFISSVKAAEVTHEFKVFIGPFDASRTTFSYTLTPNSYSVKSEVKTAGMFNSLYPFKAKYFTDGKIKNNQLETAHYHYSSQSRFNNRHKELVYNEQGIPVYRISGKNNKEKKVKLEDSPKNQGTTDLQTVFAELAKQYNEVRFCDSRMQVYDGKRRFDVIFQDEGKEEISANEHSPYSGQATKCSIYIDKLGEKGDDLLWQLTSDRPIYFWILEHQGKPFIARVLVKETPLGRLEVYTSKVSVKE